MAKSDFSAELRTGASEPVWVEDYVVRTSDGESVGTVAAVLERGGEQLLVVERGLVPKAQDRRAVPWSQVETVDHEALAVWLTLDERGFLDGAEELDPARAEPRGPVDRRLLRLAILCAGLAAFSFFLLAAAASAAGSVLPLLLIGIPAAFAVAAGLLGYRAYRSPR